MQLVSTGIPVEALGRMSLDEADAGERSFSEPQESSEEELGMAFSPGKMVDDIVGDDEKEGSNDPEEITFSGRATRKQLYALICQKLTPVDQVRWRMRGCLLLLLFHQPISTPPPQYQVQSQLHLHQRRQQI